jgi:hypothetical protein
MNRPPQEADCRSYSKAATAAAAPGGAYCGDVRCFYHGHIRTCGGTYEKVRGRLMVACIWVAALEGCGVRLCEKHHVLWHGIREFHLVPCNCPIVAEFGWRLLCRECGSTES